MREEVNEDQLHQNQMGQLDQALIEDKLLLILVLVWLLAQVLNLVHNLALVLVQDLVFL